MVNIVSLLKEQHWIVLVMIGALLFNLIVYTNYVFIFIVGLVLSIHFYTNPKQLSEINKDKKDVESIIEKFDIQDIATNFYDIYKVPNKFKYIYIKPEILKNLLNLKFIQKFDHTIYIKIFVLIEKFLRIFYNTIVKRYEANINLEKMKELHQELKNYKEEIKLNIPEYSSRIKRFGKRSLHSVIDSDMNVLINFLGKKIRISKALVEGKIK
jgi:hypothetical protein